MGIMPLAPQLWKKIKAKKKELNRHPRKFRANSERGDAAGRAKKTGATQAAPRILSLLESRVEFIGKGLIRPFRAEYPVHYCHQPHDDYPPSGGRQGDGD